MAARGRTEMAEPRVPLLIRIRSSLKAALAELAKRERRSLNRQIEFLLDRALEVQTKSERAEESNLRRTGRQSARSKD